MSPPAAAPRPRHRTLVTVLVVLALVGAGVVAVGALGFCSVVGCTFLREQFEPDGDEATAARASARADTAALADRLATGREVLATATADGCTTGQNNWKRKDTYSHECFLLDSRLVLVTSDPEAVGDGLTAADAVLREAGCAPGSPRGGLDRVRDEYWDADNPQVGRYGAAGLPGAVYSCPDDRVVTVQPTSARASASAPGVDAVPASFDEVLAADWYTPADATALARSRAALALEVTVRDGYYRTRF